jgi:hypothetical protein
MEHGSVQVSSIETSFDSSIYMYILEFLYIISELKKIFIRLHIPYSPSSVVTLSLPVQSFTWWLHVTWRE